MDIEIAKMLQILESLLKNSIYDKDYSIIRSTYELLDTKLTNISNYDLESIRKNIEYLDRKYDDLEELVNLYDSINGYYKNIIRKKQVSEIRKNNQAHIKKFV